MSELKTDNKNIEWKLIEENCKPYGGYINVITKCGGTLVSQIWIKSMQEYANQQNQELQRQVKELKQENELQQEHLMHNEAELIPLRECYEKERVKNG